MPPVHAANLVANSGNTTYGVDVIRFDLVSSLYEILDNNPVAGDLKHGESDVTSLLCKFRSGRRFIYGNTHLPNYKRGKSSSVVFPDNMPPVSNYLVCYLCASYWS